MKKKAELLKKGDKITLGGEVLVVHSVEISDVSKQGTKKCRLEAVKSNGETIAIIRPADYPFECS